jgi:ATP-dependent DNA helicase HFM1/MER3
LARLFTLTNPPARLWKEPKKRLEAHNEDLKSMYMSSFLV